MQDRLRDKGTNLLRSALLAVILALCGSVWIQPLAHLFRQWSETTAPLSAGMITLTTILLAALVGLLRPLQTPTRGALAGALAMLGSFLVEPHSWAAALSLPLMGIALGWGANFLQSRLPHGSDTGFPKRPAIAALWIILATVSVVQMGRLSTWITDPNYDFVLTTRNPFWYKHLCLPAYLYGGELAERGDPNVYAAEHYPGTNPEAVPNTRVAGMHVEDPYQYPPQFLLLPIAALKLSSNFADLRIFWFALQVTFFAGVFLALASWIGGPAGRLAMWSLPPLFGAFPMLHNFQFGQFHLFAVALAIGGMLAFQYQKRATGAFLLAWAILAKVFPLLLLPVLAVNRKFRELAWVAGWGLGLTVLTFLLLGPAPFEAFLEYHAPRLQSGAAFAFDEVWPELADLVVVDNQGVFGLARKFGISKPVAADAGRAFGLLLLLGAAAFGLRFSKKSRWHSGILWLSLLGLGSMASPGAWGDYVPTVAIWLLALLLVVVAEDRRWRLPFLTVALFEGLLLGTMPIGDWAPVELMIPLSAVGCLLMLGLYGATLVLAPRQSVAKDNAPAEGRSEELRPAA